MNFEDRADFNSSTRNQVFLQFGNVDINISSVYRLETKGETAWDEKQFVEDIAASYQTFLEAYILPRLSIHTETSHSSSLSEKPGYIQDLYLCKATLPIVGDDDLPESHAKYQYTKSKKKDDQHTTEELEELELQSARCAERVRPLIHLCGIEARRRMTADFNARLTAFTLGIRDKFSCNRSARFHVVDLNQYIRKESDSDEVDAQYITNDPTNLHVTWENTLQFWVQELASAGLEASHMPAKGKLDEQWAKYSDRKEKQRKTMRQKGKALEAT
ncbi:hypothetical protein N0V82_003997 [Gnomoniopsis sp. IMI 355080]|nr:hypothetical protein N0V82_003997 [Gnomoniopsis sp. IMI 355080]